MRGGALDTPSNDTDLHAFLAKLTAQNGHVIYDQLPMSAAPVSYPSGFSVLNAVWLAMSGLTPVAVVNEQLTLQSCLADHVVAVQEEPQRERRSRGAADVEAGKRSSIGGRGAASLGAESALPLEGRGDDDEIPVG